MTVARIIVTDPCPDNRESLAEVLRLYGFAAEAVEDLDTLLIRLRAGPADVVVTEVFGDLDRTCRAVRTVAPGVRIAFHTTREQPADLRLARALGCRHFLKATRTGDLLKWLTNWPRAAGCGAAGGGWSGGDPEEVLSDPYYLRLRNRIVNGHYSHNLAGAPSDV